MIDRRVGRQCGRLQSGLPGLWLQEIKDGGHLAGMRVKIRVPRGAWADFMAGKDGECIINHHRHGCCPVEGEQAGPLPPSPYTRAYDQRLFSLQVCVDNGKIGRVSTDCEVGRGMVMASTSWVSRMGLRSRGRHKLTKPQPPRKAPLAQRMAAPVFPMEPARIKR